MSPELLLECPETKCLTARLRTAEKEADYLKMRSMREDIKAVETLKKTADQLARESQTQRREEQER